MAQDRDELLAQFSDGAFVEQCGVLLFLAQLSFELGGNERRKSCEHGQNSRLLDLRRTRIDCTQISEVAPITQYDRHRNLNLDRLKFSRRMSVVQPIGAGVLNDDRDA